MTLVVDASVAVKWVLPEDGAERAAILRERLDELIAPSLIVAEIGNALRKRVLKEELSAAEAVSALQIATGLLSRLVPLPELALRALELSTEVRHPIYDCFYLALAGRERAALISADARLLRAARRAQDIDIEPL